MHGSDQNSKSIIELQQDQERRIAKVQRSLIAAVGLVILFVAGLAIWAASHFSPSEADKFAAFVGGVGGPILATITILSVLFTISFQLEELGNSRIEMKRSADSLAMQALIAHHQNFESAFFQILSVHNSIIDSLKLDGLEGRAVIRVLHDRLAQKIWDISRNDPDPVNASENIKNAYEQFWKDEAGGNILGQYFRNLYRMLNFVENKADIKITTNLDVNVNHIKTEAMEYIKLVRAQLSSNELILIFYNCLTARGKKFKTLAEKWELFDNLEEEKLLNKYHVGLLNKKSFGGNLELIKLHEKYFDRTK